MTSTRASDYSSFAVLALASIALALVACSAPQPTTTAPPARANQPAANRAPVNPVGVNPAAANPGPNQTPEPAANQAANPAAPRVVNPTPNPTAAAAIYNLTGTPGDEPMSTYTDPSQQFSFLHPAAWARSTPNGEAVRVTGRDQFMSVAVISTAQPALDFAAADAQRLAAAGQGYSSPGPRAFAVAATNGALLQYNWQAGPSAVTGKLVPSIANRYYIPGPGGKIAVLTYSSANNTFDAEDAEDFANTFQWLS